ncbi:N-acetyltransferase [Actinopolyspora erythraea]|uniref:GNAT family acetyltransferase n=1 Tax=Actinopolyspora erythraea TaxID=414996 RepID=A0A099D6B0_9ACTN|nr:N-acetyltransferase [Actinopolyspora erythraea]KGI81377.1 GNAT family acetyltransferase [Actinopolyspora erythraea]
MVPGYGSETARRLQERVARALPAEHVERLGDWWLRHAPSASWWTSTVLPHGVLGGDWLMRAVSAAEGFYVGFGRAATFQITPGACPVELDALLAERGYYRHTLMSLWAAAVDDVRARARTSGARTQLVESPAAGWFDVWHAVHGDGGDRRPEWEMLARGQQPSAYAGVLDGGELVAVGRAVVDSGWAGVFGMATLPRARGRGAAGDVLESLADWASGLGAGGMYLRVDVDNTSALRLYERVGFTEVCRYHYRSETLS